MTPPLTPYEKPRVTGGIYGRCFLSLTLGMIIFQIFSTLSVYLANSRVIRTVDVISREGYLAVPNARILPGLETTANAWCGGLFFTVTVGSLICLLALGCALVSSARPGLKKTISQGLATFILITALAINVKGFLMIETSALIICSCIVFFSARYLLKNVTHVFSISRTARHGIPLLVLAGLLALSARSGDSRLFTDFRDTFLMTNPLGMVVNDFYYTYTLSPAEVFKSLEQKQIKTCLLTLDKDDEPHRSELERILASNDYLVVSTYDSPDLALLSQSGKLMYFHGKTKIMESRIIDFIATPSDLLKNYSQKTDRYSFYRKLTGLSLLSGFPLFMYLMLHAALYAVARMFIPASRAAVASSAACFFIGLSGFGVLLIQKADPVTKASLREALGSPTVSRRVSGLQFLADHPFDPALYPSLFTSMASPSPVERYWFARAAAKSTDPSIVGKLTELITDSQPNVACQAIYALGMQANKGTLPVIVEKIKISGNWYVQWYAYKALKRIGWTQQRSNAKP